MPMPVINIIEVPASVDFTSPLIALQAPVPRQMLRLKPPIHSSMKHGKMFSYNF
jgi:hypothetical protein